MGKMIEIKSQVEHKKFCIDAGMNRYFINNDCKSVLLENYNKEFTIKSYVVKNKFFDAILKVLVFIMQFALYILDDFSSLRNDNEMNRNIYMKATCKAKDDSQLIIRDSNSLIYIAGSVDNIDYKTHYPYTMAQIVLLTTVIIFLTGIFLIIANSDNIYAIILGWVFLALTVIFGGIGINSVIKKCKNRIKEIRKFYKLRWEISMGIGEWENNNSIKDI
jgi:hypothetical protein